MSPAPPYSAKALTCQRQWSMTVLFRTLLDVATPEVFTNPSLWGVSAFGRSKMVRPRFQELFSRRHRHRYPSRRAG